MQNKIDMLVWSKDRPLQLDFLLQSAKKYFHDIGECGVIIDSTTPRGFELYNKVEEHHKWAEFHLELNFKKDVLVCLDWFKNDLVLGNSDDNVFISDVPYFDLEERSVAFSLRLHPAVTYCGPLQKTILKPSLHQTIPTEYWWGWGEADPAGCWGYPHPCDSNVYRRKYLIDLLNNAHFHNPGTMEDAMNNHRNSYFYLMQCAEKPSLINLCNNRVQETSGCPHGSIGASELMDKMEAGFRISLDTPIPSSDRCHIVTEYEFERFKW